MATFVTRFHYVASVAFGIYALIYLKTQGHGLPGLWFVGLAYVVLTIVTIPYWRGAPIQNMSGTFSIRSVANAARKAGSAELAKEVLEVAQRYGLRKITITMTTSDAGGVREDPGIMLSAVRRALDDLSKNNEIKNHCP